VLSILKKNKNNKKTYWQTDQVYHLLNMLTPYCCLSIHIADQPLYSLSQPAIHFSGSEKAWRFLADPTSVFKLGLAVSIVSTAEDILVHQFRWQSDTAYLNADISKVPLVVMANMSKSPAVGAVNLLSRALLHEEFGDDPSYTLHFFQQFHHLHTGILFCYVI